MFDMLFRKIIMTSKISRDQLYAQVQELLNGTERNFLETVELQVRAHPA
jgi:ribosomal protein L1